VYGYSMYNTQMDATMTGGERTVRRIDTTEQGTTALAGGARRTEA